MIIKLISVKSIIAKVISDLNLSDEELRISDMIEWCGEAIEKIGATTQFIKKVSGIDGTDYGKIIDHQCKIPYDLHQLHQVAYSFTKTGNWLPMRKATGSFAMWGNSNNNNSTTNNDVYVNDNVITNLVVDMIGNIDTSEALKLLNENSNLKTIITNLINAGTFSTNDLNSKGSGLQYSIKPGWIITNVPNGYLKLSYSAIQVDENGYPMIPDLSSYSEAIYWYITMKLKYPEYLNGRMNREIYYDIRRSWNFYRNQAYAEALMPNEDGLESIKNNWIKLYPEINEHNTFYEHVGERQYLRNNSVI